MQDTEDGDTTVVSATNDDSNSKTDLDEDGFEVVTIESDYQVSSTRYIDGGRGASNQKPCSLTIIFLPPRLPVLKCTVAA